MVTFQKGLGMFQNLYLHTLYVGLRVLLSQCQINKEITTAIFLCLVAFSAHAPFLRLRILFTQIPNQKTTKRGPTGAGKKDTRT